MSEWGDLQQQVQQESNEETSQNRNNKRKDALDGEEAILELMRDHVHRPLVHRAKALEAGTLEICTLSLVPPLRLEVPRHHALSTQREQIELALRALEHVACDDADKCGHSKELALHGADVPDGRDDVPQGHQDQNECFDMYAQVT